MFKESIFIQRKFLCNLHFQETYSISICMFLRRLIFLPNYNGIDFRKMIYLSLSCNTDFPFAWYKSHIYT